MKLVGVLVLMMVAVLGCRPPAVPALPSKGGPAWVEVQTEHFTIWTDSTRGEELAAQLERFREGLYGSSLFAEAAAGGRSLVFAFRNAEELHAYAEEHVAAYAWPGGDLWQPTLTLNADSLDMQPEVIGHELAHTISHEIIRDQPKWFAEGLAEYYETMRFEGDKVEIGRPLESTVKYLRSLDIQRRVHSRQWMTCESGECTKGSFYPVVWAAFTWLATTKPAQLIAYMRQLVVTPEAKQPAVFAQVFPEYAVPETLDEQFAEWMRHGSIRVREVRVPPKKYATTTRKLGDVEALLTRGIAKYVMGHDHSSKLPPEIAEALAIAPANLLGRLVEHMQARRTDAAIAKQVVEANKTDWRAWWLLGEALPHDAEGFEAYRTMCDLLAGGGPILIRSYCAKLPPRP